MNNDDKKLVIITEPKLFILILEDVGKMLKHEINFSIKHNEILTEQAKKKRLDSYCPNISMEAIFLNTENSKTSKPHKFVLDLSQRLHLRSSKIMLPLQKLSIYYTLRNIRQQIQNISSRVQ